jgi:hypothetical protein
MEEMNLNLFNSPTEVGLRLLFIFDKSTKAIDLQRLIYYNYLLVHSSDIDSNQKSIHPNLPNRACEMLVSRKIILKGLNLLISKGLIDVKYSKSGLKYKAISETTFFVSHFESEYSNLLKEKAQWTIDNFEKISDGGLRDLMNKNLGKWGSEFTREYNILNEKNA